MAASTAAGGPKLVVNVFPLLPRPLVQDLSLIPVTTLEEVLEIISLGLKVRATHETKMNQVKGKGRTFGTARGAAVAAADFCVFQNEKLVHT